MVDALCILLIGGFFVALIWSIAKGPDKRPAAAAPPPITPESTTPGPVGLCCLSCYTTVRVVSHEEYIEFTEAGRKIYCGRCLTAIETYKKEQTRK